MASEVVRVLLIEDNPVEARLLVEYVRMANATDVVLEHAPTLAEALRRLSTEPFQAVLLDLALPDGPGGLGTFARVMAAAPGLPVILLTTADDEMVAARAVQAGAQDYLAKTEIHPMLLVRAIRYAVERRAAAAALQESEEKYRVVVETASDGVVTVDETNVIQFANRAAERMFGYAEGELLGRPVTELMPPDQRDGHRNGLARYVATGEQRRDWSQFPAMGRRTDGSEVPLELSFGESRLGGQRVFTAVIRDITERRRAEDALRESEERLRQAQKMEAVGRLAGGIAHDFNNLLTVIRGHTQLMLLDIDPEAADLREGLQDVELAVDRAANLTRQLLAFSRQQVQQPQVLDLNAVVEDVARMLQRLIGEQVELQVVLDPDARPVWADRGQMEQVLLNLAVNARDAMPNGGRLRLCTRNATGEGGEHAVIEVSDTGVGMDAAVRERMFEPFFTTKPQGKGTGLGLAMVYGIVKQSDGFIEVESEPGNGTTVRVALPHTERVAAGRERSVATAEPTPGRGTVLLAEDEPAVRQLARRVLARAGYTVLEAEDGVAALETARSDPRVDLLLTDLIMPRMGGRELARQLRADRPGLRVLYMSGYADSDRELELSSTEAFLEKPFNPMALAAKVDELLRANDPASV
jgi:two-component system, cell cycle sensor histidine kinase and response regulator CckA